MKADILHTHNGSIPRFKFNTQVLKLGDGVGGTRLAFDGGRSF